MDPPKLRLDPPLLNSANPWATSLADLQTLYQCPHTGAVTTRTALLKGFPHDPRIHQYAFFDPVSHETHPEHAVSNQARGSLNTLGYSPVTLGQYLDFIQAIVGASNVGRSSVTTSDGMVMKGKVFIISVTGTAPEVAECYTLISARSAQIAAPLAMEINLSCPNIPSHPPPAYSSRELSAYIRAASDATPQGALMTVPLGIKIPPYTHSDEFSGLSDGIKGAASERFPKPISFITATNTLGGCVILSSEGGMDDADVKPVLNSATGLGIGGMAGAPLHPLALGNVMTIRKMLNADELLRHISIIGVGGVEDTESYERMRAVGASAVGVGTGLGRRGVGVFADILGQAGSR